MKNVKSPSDINCLDAQKILYFRVNVITNKIYVSTFNSDPYQYKYKSKLHK